VGASPLSEPAAATNRKRSAEASDRRRDNDSDESRPRPRSRKLLVVSAISLTAGLGAAALAFLGYANSDRYFLACEAERAIAEQGRSFPPWGTRALAGEAWKPLKITPETRCQPRETDDLQALERLYLSMITDQATALLTAREVTRLEDAEALLKQALLLTRPPEYEPEKLAKERSEHHKEIERLLGDVAYWRASAKLREAATALGEAAKQFDSADAQHPRHVSDASAWATYARKLAQELHAGPSGTPASPAVSPATPPTASPAAPPTASPAAPPAGSPDATGAVPTAEHPNAPMGVALPVEPDQGSATGSASEPSSAPAPPDAGVPTGGVLL
jgi:hypothetical protein